MKISFVIPAYNEEQYIAPCLEAILREAKGRGDIEVIVVDNNSNDHTDAVVAHYPSVKLLREKQRGANRTRETGFLASRGEFVAFLDADTRMPPGWIEKAEREFAGDQKLACVSGPFIYYDLSIGLRAMVRVFYFLAYLSYLLGRYAFGRATVMQGGNYIVRRTMLDAIGGHNVAITFYGDDTDLAIRLSEVGRVKFSFALPILTSGRRLAKEGAFTMGLRYSINNLWMVIFRRPYTTTSKEIRFASGGTVYEPEHKWKERFIAIVFTTAVAFLFAALLLAAYLLIKILIAAALFLANRLAGS